MAFSFPNYLDHPNLQFQHPHQEHHQQSIAVDNHQLQALPANPPPLVVGGAGSIRPGSMVDRARMAKFPLPEAAAKCPRCNSTNTKFCYYNNYNLSQPRHFCKGCRRYWTKGGALRNVPVGGGCRRNKRSKSTGTSSSKSTTGDERQIGTSNNNSNATTITTNMAGHHFQQPSTPSPLMATFHNFNQYEDIRFNNLSATGGSGSAEPPMWMLPAFQGGFDDPPTSLFQVQREGVEDHHQLPSSANNISAVKMGNHQNRNQELNLSRQDLLDSSVTPQQNWGSNSWTNGFSGLNSSTSTHLS